jgi:hypothetical protein
VEWGDGADGMKVGRVEENILIKGRAINLNKEYDI